MFSLMLRLSSCARLLKMVMSISPVPSSVLIPSFSNTTATFFSFSFRIVTSESTVFLANLLTDFVRIMSIFPARADFVAFLFCTDHRYVFGFKNCQKQRTVNGKSTVQIQARLKGEDIACLLAQLGLNGDNTQGTSSDYSSLSPITISLWIDKKTYYP